MRFMTVESSIPAAALRHPGLRALPPREDPELIISFLVLCRITLDEAAAYLIHGTVPDGHELHETKLNLGGIYGFITGISGISRLLRLSRSLSYLTLLRPKSDSGQLSIHLLRQIDFGRADFWLW
jgi:hypothetical protein